MSEIDDLLAQFRGIPRTYRADPPARARNLDRLMDQLTARYKIESPRIEHLIIQHWRTIVGPHRAHRCKPSKILDDGKLVITTTNSTLRSELQFDAEQILSNLHRAIGNGTIHSIIVR
jgi:predicted nucleic acid-binding Zn ribbon protein